MKIIYCIAECREYWMILLHFDAVAGAIKEPSCQSMLANIVCNIILYLNANACMFDRVTHRSIVAEIENVD